MSKKEVKKIENKGCKHSGAKERTVEISGVKYLQMYCPSCDSVLRSRLKGKEKEGK